MEGVDYAGDRPNPQCLYDHGKRFVVRYFGPGGSWKHASLTEVRAIHAAGLSLVANAEGAARDPMQGRTMGKAHAIAANAATKGVGLPGDRPIYFSIDFDMQPHEAGAVANYLRGCADIIGLERVGVYAGYRQIEYFAGNRLAAWFWQTYAWSAGRWSNHNHLEQYRNGQTVCGADVDLCRNRTLDFGQWPHPVETIGSAPAPNIPVPGLGPWDYTDVISGLSADVTGLGVTMDATARATDALRGL